MKVTKSIPSISYLALVILLLFAATSDAKKPSSNTFTFPSTGVGVKGEAVLLAIDDHLLPFRRDLCYYMSTPSVRKEPIITPDRSDPNRLHQISVNFYGTVLYDQGKFRMWHSSGFFKTPWKRGQPLPEIKSGPMHYAESNDGIHWTKPNLGQVSINGSTKNNALAFPDPQCLCPCMIKDEEDPDPKRRYKMTYSTWALVRGYKNLPVTRTATSPDGIRWKPGPEMPIDSFMEQSSFYKFNNYFFVNAQTYERSDGGAFEARQGYVRISADFDNWVQGPAESFMLPEPEDPQKRGIAGSYDQVHLGVGAASFGNVMVGLYGLWHNRPGPEGSTGWFSGHGGTWCDLSLVVSNDGIHFREPVKGYVFISQKDSPVTPVKGKNYPTNLCQGNGIVNVDDKTFIYHGRWRNAPEPDYYSEIAVATLPRDRFGAIGLIPPLSRHSETPEGASEGWVWSAPIKLPASGCDIFLNADCANFMNVEISDERFNLIPEFSGANSGKVGTKAGFDCPVTWSKGTLSSLGAKTIRLRVNLKKDKNSDPRLYAIYLKATK